MATPPKCCWCGGPIRKRTGKVYIVDKIKSEYHRSSSGFIRYVEVGGNWPKTKADCQKLTNQKVISVSYSPVQDENFNYTGTKIHSFGEWDGSSYEDAYFCNGDHAKQLGYLAATQGWIRRKVKVPHG